MNSPLDRLFLLLAGYPPPQHLGLEAAPRLERTTHLSAGDGGLFAVSDPPGRRRFSGGTGGLPAPIRLAGGPSADLSKGCAVG